MKLKPDLSILKSLLFTYSIENYDDPERERFIASKNVNDETELAELFEKLTKPEFLSYKIEIQQWHIETLQHYLNIDENFSSVFYLLDTYFDDEITDHRQFMRVLLRCLQHYRLETDASGCSQTNK
ncbi:MULTISPECIES: hypothetical protein [Pseudomonas]|uniref:CdiI immunity protein domain-containing protein n=2 Tax=Pseudomonas TaxID=286 RepID=A0A0D0S101_PSEFL|nr:MULTISPECIES: hypothetical protein [Pseudomonas fluorescens group]AZE61664.1 hypothetical protein C4K02_3304 [Pseudomonas synxantha]KIR16038.1 hypothetical protein PFLU3_54080 [Pseudomonas fluorescens]